MRGFVWFREDLRISDHTALYHAQKHCVDGVIALYVIDVSFWNQHHVAPHRIAFLLAGLESLKASLSQYHIPLLIHHQENHSGPLPSALVKKCAIHHVTALFFNRQYEVNESKRDDAVCSYLKAHAIACYAYDDAVILAPNSVTTHQKQHFSVFSAYKRQWCVQFSTLYPEGMSLFPMPNKQTIRSISSSVVPKQLAGIARSNIDPTLWIAGEGEAKTRLAHFIQYQLSHYHEDRDFPAKEGTSQLSPYLCAGMISPRVCFMAAFEANAQCIAHGQAGAVAWLNELIWRDFYKHLLVAVPRLSKGRAYRLQTEYLPWEFNETQFIAWQNGQTGFPFVDAGMRQLQQTGWMHNRLRMVVAMFLTKQLFFNWRLGEDHFMRHLIDGDLAANNGGWQWSASTGTDAAPYFRIFNPIRQSERFDPDGTFIRKYCQELAGLNHRVIHHPHERSPNEAKQCAYPMPIIDLKMARLKIQDAFKQLPRL